MHRLRRRDALVAVSAALALLVTGVVVHEVVQHAREHPVASSSRALAPHRSLPPNLAPLRNALREGRDVTVAGLGSSVGNGAGLPDPAGQSPTGHLVQLLKNAYPRSTILAENRSVDGSTAFDGLEVYLQQVQPLHPTVLLVAFGMNDGQAAQFNSGETLPGGMDTMRQIIETAREDGTTVLVATTPSPHTGGNNTSLPEGMPVIYPVADGVPEPTGAKSIVLIDGQPFDARHAIWNQGLRELAAAEQVTVLDAAAHWPAAVAEHGEDRLYEVQHGADDPGRFVHPNLLGHRLSYWRAEADFTTRLRAAVGDESADPMSTASLTPAPAGGSAPR